MTDAVRAAVHAELDGILPHVVRALDRNQAYEDLSDRLRTAERRLEGRRERPLVLAVHAVLTRLRHLDFDRAVKDALEADLVRALREAGFTEIGEAGEAFDPARHQPLGGRAVDGQAVVREVAARGLSCMGEVIVRAQVQISPPTSKE